MTLERLDIEKFKEACDQARRLVNGDMVDAVPHMSIRTLSIREIYHGAFEDADIWTKSDQEIYESLNPILSYDDLFAIFTLAANRAVHVNRQGATQKQCAYLAHLLQGTRQQPFGSDTNYVLTKAEASKMIATSK